MKWNEFDANIREYLRVLRYDQRLFDVTLVSDDGQHIQAHKIVLSAGSLFFSDIFLKSNQANMLIYLKGINSVQLEHILDFIYNGEAFVGHEEFEEFVETGKALQVKGFKGDVVGVGESVREKSLTYLYENKEIHKNRNDITEENGTWTWDTFETLVKNESSLEVVSEERDEKIIYMDKINDMDLRIEQMIEKSDGVWNCKVCGRTSTHSGHIKEHTETHIKGISHSCHICSQSFPNRKCLRMHISRIHSALLSCDLCGKSGMNKMVYNDHKQSKKHKTLSGTLS